MQKHKVKYGIETGALVAAWIIGVWSITTHASRNGGTRYRSRGVELRPDYRVVYLAWHARTP